MTKTNEQRESGCGASALLFGGMADIPESVAVCPECGGKLYVECMEWDSETGQPTTGGLNVSCLDDEKAMDAWERSPDDGTTLRDVSHRWWQSDWQPVIDDVCEWAGAVEP